MNRLDISRFICERLLAEKHILREKMKESGSIPYFVIDDLFPEDLAKSLEVEFPSGESMTRNQTLREKKYISAQMDKHSPLIEECLYAFQEKSVIDIIEDITSFEQLEADESLYAGGISLMQKGDYLNPHLDNSHNMDRSKWRTLNLLYYCTSNWSLESGGNLELWPNGVKDNEGITVVSKFNRLAVMATHDASWHSVSPVLDCQPRRCISNYYFSCDPVRASDQFHVTSFLARPGHPLSNFALKMDNIARSTIRKFFNTGIKKTKHFYK